ncbi:ABC transporter permease [Caulobacter sp. KR2-114]|uniref:ABC transporter permease n=1 Tax=Caulobacter sp. KR2-114 TaxID=3400912 RepID=UPI003C123A26
MTSEAPLAATLDVKRWWPAPMLPESDGRQLTLLFVLVVLCCLASLSVIGALAASRAADGWRSQLVGSATVVVRASERESADAAAARATEALAGVKGVTEARALERDKAEALIKPYLGPDPLPADLPVPRLVAVELDRKAPADAAALQAALKTAGVDATVDDHSLWTRQITAAGAVARWAASGLFVMILAAAAALIAFATRQGLATGHELVTVLHLAGATDAFVARQFQARFGRMAFFAGLWGGVLAAAAAAALKLSSGGQTIAALLPVAWTDLLAPLPCPFIAALIAAVTARLTAQGVLGRMP